MGKKNHLHTTNGEEMHQHSPTNALAERKTTYNVIKIVFDYVL